ncbi:hypothetical protein LAZ67_7000181 [Cordylochernes scorpioides]|uniref:Uncharacterized protein n=1 Tax=Cordylochernes scorpioides TaxID=51811 RepID=A0ABY6KN88_9ARAC|nr:hypothetical protein LAZ67_7000181 [Cordylochernes scorpioides]
MCHKSVIFPSWANKMQTQQPLLKRNFVKFETIMQSNASRRFAKTIIQCKTCDTCIALARKKGTHLVEKPLLTLLHDLVLVGLPVLVVADTLRRGPLPRGSPGVVVHVVHPASGVPPHLPPGPILLSPAGTFLHQGITEGDKTVDVKGGSNTRLVEVYGEKCMDIKNVRKWCREFNEGRINVHDEQRSGRPSLPESTVARIDEMVHANRRITLEEIEDDDEVKEEVDKWLKEAAGEWYNTGITKLVDRMKKVIEHQGVYVEK